MEKLIEFLRDPLLQGVAAIIGILAAVIPAIVVIIRKISGTVQGKVRQTVLVSAVTLLGLIIVFVLFRVFLPTQERIGASTNITVFADQTWQDTGISLQKGDRLELRATGNWSTGDDFIGPQGLSQGACPHCILNSANLGELIGRVANGAPFRIGGANAITVSQNGNLFLAMNDCLGSNVECYNNNRGDLQVEILIRHSAR